MTLSENITSRVMSKLGFREPVNHPDWNSIVIAVQDCVDSEMESMKRIAGRDSIPSAKAILSYEVRSRWWTHSLGIGWVQRIVGRRIGRKACRKYIRYQKSLSGKALVDRMRHVDQA